MTDVIPAGRLRALACLAGLLLGGCSLQTMHRELIAPEDLLTLDRHPPYLKAHLRDGGVLILERWTVDEGSRLVSGFGKRFDAGRDQLDSGPLTVAVDSVAIFESNVLQTSPAVGPLTVLSVASAAVSTYCLINPKACFGSCPTFYDAADTAAGLQAEGFSASVAPVLESDDLDALFGCREQEGRLELLMTNEALETHVVRRADLLTAERAADERVLAGPGGRFWRTAGPLVPRRALAAEGDCTALLGALDGLERTSPADSSDLATREFIELEFPAAGPGPLGLVVVSRQSLLSTYLFYQGLAYLGRQAGAMLPRATRILEPAADRRTLGSLLGGIEVQVLAADGRWLAAGTVGETGPLARNQHFLPLPGAGPPPVRVRLCLTRGHWRLDQVALVSVRGEAAVRRLTPAQVLRDGREDAVALACLTDPARTLLTLPGDRYRLVYRLPPTAAGRDFFLDSRGYYLEWMREEWLAEEDPRRAAALLLDPAGSLRALAPAFKRLEPAMEAQFWGSRYAR